MGEKEPTRNVELQKTDGGKYVARVTLTEFEYNETYGKNVAQRPKKIGQYAFVPLDDDVFADRWRGEVPETKGTPVAYIGSNTGKNYYESKETDKLPVDVLETLEETGLSLVENVEGGWAEWDGRPEWSESYIDLSEANVVDTELVIETRRAQ